MPFDIGYIVPTGNLLGVSKLRLQVKPPAGYKAEDADHINWGDLRVFCGPDAPYVPRIWINAPESDITAKVGELVFFSGGAEGEQSKVLQRHPSPSTNQFPDISLLEPDWKGNAIPWQSLSWTVNIVHGQGQGSHIHPATFYFPQTGWGSFLVEAHTNNPNEVRILSFILEKS